MGSNINIEVDDKFLQNFFGLVDQQPPDTVTLDSLNDVVKMIKDKISSKALSSGNFSANQSSTELNLKPSDSDVNRPKTILIIDDLGVIIYQLKALFEREDFEVTISQEVNDAIDKFKKQDFGYVVIDLYIPTDREGFILLDEIKKLALLCNLNTKIVVMSASTKPEYKTKCVNRGADIYIEKAPNWQEKILEACVES